MDEFKLLAEHFADKDDINIVIKGEEASADPNTRTLTLPEDVPEEMFGVTLATLLHEAHHIKHSQGLPKADAQSGVAGLLLNALEDVRIDTKIIDKYPNAKGLYADLLAYYKSKYGDKLANIPKELKYVRETILRSYGHNSLFDQYKDKSPEVEEFFKRNGKKIDEIINRVKKARKVSELNKCVEDFYKVIFEEDLEDLEKLLKQLDQQNGNAMKRMAQAQGEYGQASSEFQNAQQQEEQTSKQQRQEENNSKYYADRAKRMFEESKRLSGQQQQERESQAKQMEAAAKQAKRNADQAKDKLNQIHSDPTFQQKKDRAQKASSELKKATSEAVTTQRIAQKMRDDQNKQAAQKLKDVAKFTISFSNIDKNDFKVKNFKISQTLEERLLEFLKNREERRLILDDGRIIPNRLPTYYEPLSLFEQRLDDSQSKTRIFFVVDRSGSMGGAKYHTTCAALDNICGVIERGINHYGMDLEYSIFSFDTETELIKDFEDKYEQQKTAAGLAPRGGTHPVRTLETVESVICDKVGTKEFVFFITDGEMPDDAYEYIEQQMGGKKKWVFLGVDIYDGNIKSKRFFGDYNIRDPKDLQKVLTRAIENAL